MATISVSLVVVAMSAEHADAGQGQYTVRPGDTLGSIAADHGVRVSEIRTWNDLSGDAIQAGQTLRIRSSGTATGDRIRREYSVSAGDTGLAIARDLGVSVADLQRWNPRVNFNRLQIGQVLVAWVDPPAAAQRGGTVAYGRPQQGRLLNGVQLGTGPGYRVRRPDRSWGTPLTVESIRDGYARLAHNDPSVAPALVADISYQRGGRIGGHSSHQNGLDVDATYFKRGESDFNEWRRVTAESLDVERQWHLFRQWLLDDTIEFIFVDYELQRPLYEYARSRGASDEELAEWFQYPNRGRRTGIIRHEPGHADHYHVRFKERR